MHIPVWPQNQLTTILRPMKIMFDGCMVAFCLGLGIVLGQLSLLDSFGTFVRSQFISIQIVLMILHYM